MDPQTLVLEGPWNLNWKYSYRTGSVKKHLHKKVKIEGADVNITEIEVTPLEVITKGKATFASEELRRQFTSMDIDCITLTDGTVIWVEANGGGCGTSKNPLEMVRRVYDVEGYATIEVIGQPLNPNEVKSVTIGGVEIEL